MCEAISTSHKLTVPMKIEISLWKIKLQNAINATGLASIRIALLDTINVEWYTPLFYRSQCITPTMGDKILSTFDWICSFVESHWIWSSIRFFFCYGDAVCVCVYGCVCLVFVHEFTFQFKINRNFMSFIHFVWTSTERIFLCFVFDCHFTFHFFLLILCVACSLAVFLFNVIFGRWRCRSIYFDGYLNWRMNFWCRRCWMISVQHTVYTW